MAKGILSGSGIIDLYDYNNNLIVSSPTLIDSALNLTITKEEARGGQGNAFLGNYYHTSNFGLTLTDQIWNLQYLSLNCGGAITAGADVMTIESITTTVANQITVTGTPTNFTDTSGDIGWYKLKSEDDSQYKKITFTGKVATVPNLASGTAICVKYPIVSNSARSFKINTQFIPNIVRAELTFGLYRSAITNTAAVNSDSSKIGNIIVKVPQFQFDGNVTLSLSSTTNATVPLTGTALANYTGACDGQAWYAEIVENIFNQDEFANVISLAVADNDVQLVEGESSTLSVYKIYNDGTVASPVTNSKLTFTAQSGKTSVYTVTADGVITAGSTAGEGYIDISVTSKPELTGSAYVTVTAP